MPRLIDLVGRMVFPLLENNKAIDVVHRAWTRSSVDSSREDVYATAFTAALNDVLSSYPVYALDVAQSWDAATSGWVLSFDLYDLVLPPRSLPTEEADPCSQLAVAFRHLDLLSSDGERLPAEAYDLFVSSLIEHAVKAFREVAYGESPRFRQELLAELTENEASTFEGSSSELILAASVMLRGRWRGDVEELDLSILLLEIAVNVGTDKKAIIEAASVALSSPFHEGRLLDLAKEMLARALAQTPPVDFEARLQIAQLLLIVDDASFVEGRQLVEQLLEQDPSRLPQIVDALLLMVRGQFDRRVGFVMVAHQWERLIDFVLAIDPDSIGQIVQLLVDIYSRSHDLKFLRQAKDILLTRLKDLETNQVPKYADSLFSILVVYPYSRLLRYAKQIIRRGYSPERAIEVAESMVRRRIRNYEYLFWFLEKALEENPHSRQRVLRAYLHQIKDLREGNRRAELHWVSERIISLVDDPLQLIRHSGNTLSQQLIALVELASILEGLESSGRYSRVDVAQIAHALFWDANITARLKALVDLIQREKGPHANGGFRGLALDLLLSDKGGIPDLIGEIQRWRQIGNAYRGNVASALSELLEALLKAEAITPELRVRYVQTALGMGYFDDWLEKYGEQVLNWRLPADLALRLGESLIYSRSRAHSLQLAFFKQVLDAPQYDKARLVSLLISLGARARIDDQLDVYEETLRMATDLSENVAEVDELLKQAVTRNVYSADFAYGQIAWPTMGYMPARRVERHTEIDFPDVCAIGRPVQLRIKLRRERPVWSRAFEKVEVEVSPDLKEITIHVNVSAPAFAIQQPHKSLVLLVEKDSDELSFTLVPLEEGEQSIEIEFIHGATRVGYAVVKTEIRQETEEPSHSNVAILEDHAEGLRKLTHKPRNPDLYMIHVYWQPREGKLSYTIFSAENLKNAQAREQANPSAEEDASAYLHNLDSFLTEAANQRNPSEEDWESLMFNLCSMGDDLRTKLVPEQVSDSVASWKTGSVVVISTNEQWIPWELLHDDLGFWGDRFILARLPRHLEGTHLGRSVETESMRPGRTRKIVNVIGGDLERKYIPQIVALFDNFKPLDVVLLQGRPIFVLKAELSDADILHMTCHGDVEKHYLQVSAKRGLVTNLTPQGVRLLSIKPGSMVFANACSSAAPTLSLGQFRSFGWEFYLRHAVFVGTLGSVPVGYANDFAQVVYRELLRQDQPSSIGQAIAVARQEAVKQRNIFWLFYCIYGDPDFTVAWA
jgi:hypothetical protein